MNKPNYYAILTAEVRYDNRLSDKAKLIYAELTALANSNGFAHPTNDYLSELYGVNPVTISRIIAELSALEYIKIEVTKSRSGTLRKIFIGHKKRSKKSAEKDTLALNKNDKCALNNSVDSALNKNDKCNLINNTSKSNNTRKESKKGALKTPSLDSILELSTQLKIDETVATKFYHFYKLKGFTNEMINNLEDALQLWNSREFTNQSTSGKNQKEVKSTPNWVESYLKDFENMEDEE